MLGEGCIDVGGLAAHVAIAGYTGDVEIEILSERAWAGDLDAWLDLAVARYAAIEVPPSGNRADHASVHA